MDMGDPVTIIPTGHEAWTHTATPEIYGGGADKRNLMDIGAVNAKTDVNAEEYARICSDLTAVTRTAPLFWLSLLIHYSAGTASADVVASGIQWADPVDSYAGNASPDPVHPTVIADGGTPSSLIIAFWGLYVATPTPHLLCPGPYGNTDPAYIRDVQVSGSVGGVTYTGGVIVLTGCTTDGAVVRVRAY
jgi:hypothetical protein